MVYVLTPNRTTQTYDRVLTALNNLQTNLDPKMIVSDFEQASLTSFSDHFPNAEQQGCYFHFSQSVFRKIQTFPEIYSRYKADADFNLKIKQLLALAFVPPPAVTPTFDALLEDPFYQTNEELLVDLITYFERTWIGLWNRRKTARLAPPFPIDKWNCFNSVVDGLPKTNNGAEGFTNAFASLLGAHKPTIYKLIDALKKQQSLTELRMNQYIAGNVSGPSKKYAAHAMRLKTLVESYGETGHDDIEYLRFIAHHISMI